MFVILILLSLLSGLIGFLFLTEATMGVGWIGLACFLAMLARINQADGNHEELMRELEKVGGEKQQ